MKVLTLVTQQAAVRHVTHERVFKQISRVRRQALPKQQTCSHETVECRLKFRLLLAHHSLQERMRELAPDCRPGLCDFLRGSKPVEPWLFPRRTAECHQYARLCPAHCAK